MAPNRCAAAYFGCFGGRNRRHAGHAVRVARPLGTGAGYDAQHARRGGTVPATVPALAQIEATPKPVPSKRDEIAAKRAKRQAEFLAAGRSYVVEGSDER